MFFHSRIKYKQPIRFSLLALCLLLLSACATTQKVAIKQTDVNCAFLANECALLTPGGESQAGLRYINPAAQWTYAERGLQPRSKRLRNDGLKIMMWTE